MKKLFLPLLIFSLIGTVAKADFGDADFPIGIFDDGPKSYHDARLVRVPRHIINLATKIKIPGNKNLNLTVNTKWSDTARDYGNGNRTFSVLIPTSSCRVG